MSDPGSSAQTSDARVRSCRMPPALDGGRAGADHGGTSIGAYMTDRRAFLSSMAVGAATLTLPTFNPRAIRRLEDAEGIAGARTAAALAEDESYWATIQRAFDLDRTMINLNNGG